MKLFNIKPLSQFSFCLFLILLSFSTMRSQVRIGYEATTLESPNHSLLELANPPSATGGRGLLLPRVSQTQLEIMETSIEVPDGMLVYNSTRNALMIKQGGKFLAFFSTINFVPSTFTESSTDFNGTRNVFTLDIAPVEDGTVRIIYNHIPLTQNVDFSVTGANVTFLTMVPDNLDHFGEILVEK